MECLFALTLAACLEGPRPGFTEVPVISPARLEEIITGVRTSVAAARVVACNEAEITDIIPALAQVTMRGEKFIVEAPPSYTTLWVCR